MWSGRWDNLFDPRLNLLEVLNLEPIAGVGTRLRTSGNGGSHRDWIARRRGGCHQFRNVGNPGPGRGRSGRSDKVVVAKLAVRQCGANGFGIEPAFEFEAIGMKHIPGTQASYPHVIGYKIM